MISLQIPSSVRLYEIKKIWKTDIRSYINSRSLVAFVVIFGSILLQACGKVQLSEAEACKISEGSVRQKFAWDSTFGVQSCENFLSSSEKGTAQITIKFSVAKNYLGSAQCDLEKFDQGWKILSCSDVNGIPPWVGKKVVLEKLPRIDLPVPSIDVKSLADKVWIINVWASWCSPCKEETKILQELASENRIPIVGVNYMDSLKSAKLWLDKYGNPYSMILVDSNTEYSKNELFSYGLPETLLIGKGGNIIYKNVGPLTPDIIRKDIVPLIEDNRK